MNVIQLIQTTMKIRNLFSVCLMAYSFHKDGAEIHVSLKNRTINFVGNGYNDTIKF